MYGDARRVTLETNTTFAAIEILLLISPASNYKLKHFPTIPCRGVELRLQPVAGSVSLRKHPSKIY